MEEEVVDELSSAILYSVLLIRAAPKAGLLG